MMNDPELEDFMRSMYQKILLKIEIYISKFRRFYLFTCGL